MFATLRTTWAISTLVVPLAPGAYSQETPGGRCSPAPAPCDHPRVALVLSGGGALGLAHVGVLRTLEDAGVHPDIVVGTSMGAVVGGLYGLGYSADELETAISALDWPTVFAGTPPRSALSYRRRREEESFPAELAFSLDRSGLRLPRAVINDQTLNLALRNLVQTPPLLSFDDMSVQFRAVATDIVTGEPVVLDRGDLASAMRASMSAPGVFAPERIDNRLLVDGGLSKNIPIDVARDLGADIIIVATLQGPLRPAADLRTAVDVLEQSMTLLVRTNEAAQLALLEEGDIRIAIDYGDLTTTDFVKSAELIARGQAAANRHREALAALARPGPAMDNRKTPVIDFVRIENGTLLDDAVLGARISQPIGAPLDTAALTRDVETIAALGHFERVSYRLASEDDQVGLVVEGSAKPEGLANMRLGLTLDNDFQGEGDYRLSVEYRSPPIDRFGSEFRVEAVFGDRFRASAELFQLFGPEQTLFLAPRANFAVRNVPLYRADGFKTGSYRAAYAEAQVDIGWQFGGWGEARVGVQRGSGDAELREGSAEPPSAPIEIGQLVASAGIDTLDSPYFPTEGVRLSTRWIMGDPALGASASFQTLEADATMVHSWEANSLILQAEGGSSVQGDLPIESLFRVGGLFSLSGYRSEELTGEAYAVGRAIYRRRLDTVEPLFFGVPLYAGGSLELGNAWADSDDNDLQDLALGGSIFLSADTQLGPVYLAYGRSKDDRQSLYLFVGRPF